jgi:hypothetical protein
MKVCMRQFLKHTGAHFGEHRAAKKLGIDLDAMGDGFTWRSKDMEQTKALAIKQWERCKELILNGGLDVMIMDEFTYPLHYGWIPVEEVHHYGTGCAREAGGVCRPGDGDEGYQTPVQRPRHQSAAWSRVLGGLAG